MTHDHITPAERLRAEHKVQDALADEMFSVPDRWTLREMALLALVALLFVLDFLRVGA